MMVVQAIAFQRVLPALIAAAAVLVLMWVLTWLVSRGVRHVARSMQGEEPWRDVGAWAAQLNRVLRNIIQAVALIAAAVVVLQGMGIRGTPRLTANEIIYWLRGAGLRILIIVGGTLVFLRLVQFFIDRLQDLLTSADPALVDSDERRKRVRTIARLLTVLADIVIIGIGVLMVLRQIGVDITPILTGAGIAGLAVGFGAQNLVRDLIAGFFIILENQVRVGDVATINGKSGLVEAIRLRTIVLRSGEGTVHVFPNGIITELSNQTKDFSYAVVDLGVAYKEDVDRVMRILRDIGRALRQEAAWAPMILDDLEVPGVEQFGDSAVQFKMRMKTLPGRQWPVARELRRRIKQVFDEQDIEIPVPHIAIEDARHAKSLS
jgi:small conductance mechanosensitive channel